MKYLILIIAISGLISCSEAPIIHHSCEDKEAESSYCISKEGDSECGFKTMEECQKHRDDNEIDGWCVGYKKPEEEDCEEFDLNILGAY